MADAAGRTIRSRSESPASSRPPHASTPVPRRVVYIQGSSAGCRASWNFLMGLPGVSGMWMVDVKM